jgi:hypothetical protein
MSEDEIQPVKTKYQLRKEREHEAMLERAAAEKARQEEEAEFQRAAKHAFDTIWRRFGKNRKKGRSGAFSTLLQDMTEHAAELVPYYMTAKEFVSIISEIETHTKGEDGRKDGDPRDLVSAWLRGEEDMSRVPLEKIQ